VSDLLAAGAQGDDEVVEDESGVDANTNS